MISVTYEVEISFIFHKNDYFINVTCQINVPILCYIMIIVKDFIVPLIVGNLGKLNGDFIYLYKTENLYFIICMFVSSNSDNKFKCIN
jgi:hypothetical protein